MVKFSILADFVLARQKTLYSDFALSLMKVKLLIKYFLEKSCCHTLRYNHLVDGTF